MKNTVVSPRPHAPRSLRAVLQEELARRCSDNPRYSLRAFARDLGTDHSSLSQVLRGRRRLTEASIRAFGERLGLDTTRIEEFAATESRRTASARDEESLRSVRELTEDALAVLSAPEHHAILELTWLDAFRPDVRWIARVLGLDADHVNVAVQRLIRLGMLEMSAPDVWTDLTGHSTTVVADAGFETIRRLSEQVRRRAALSPSPVGRELSLTTLAVDRSRVPEALERIARFRRELIELLSGTGVRDGVYHLELAFLPLTHDDEEPST